MKSKKKKTIGCLVGLAILFVLPPLNMIPLLLYKDIVQSHRLDRAIENDLAAIASACITLPELIPEEESSIMLGKNSDRLPDAVKRMRFSYISVNRNSVSIEMYGGFDHCGIRVERDDPEKNEWGVYRYWEGGSEKLQTVEGPPKLNQ